MYEEKMYDEAETGCFDSNSMANTGIELVEENGLISQETSPPFTPVLDYLHHHQMDSSMELHNIQNPNLGIYNTTPDNEPNNWAPTNINVEMGSFSHYINNNDHETPTTSTSDLLTLLHLPRCSFSFSSSSTLLPPNPLGFLNPVGISDNPSGSGSNTISYDPTTTMPFDPHFHLNLPPQPSPLLRDLMFQTLPMGYRGENGDGMNIGSNSLFGRLEEGEGGDIINGINGIYLEGDNHHHHMNPNGIFEFTSGNGNACVGEDKEGQCPKNFVTERQRRQNFNEKYNHLRGLVPNPTKPDRASIVKDAIDYILELKRTVGELKLLVEKKRISKERSKRHKTEEKPTPTTAPTPDSTSIVDKEKENDVHGVTDGSGQVKPDPDEGFNSNQLRSSWLLRKWKDSEVDVRIVDDDVTIKLVQRKKVNCLMAVARILDELQLDLRHVAGGHVGDYNSYLFNTKICEGSSVYASAIANKLIDVVEKQYVAVASISIPPPTSSTF